MKLFSFLESNAAAYEFSQRLVSFNFRAFLRELRAEQFFQPGLSYLDLGCGTGFLRDHLRHADYLGVDINPTYIAAARRKRGECFQVGDALAIGNLPRKFDRIIAIGLLHHLDDRQVRTVLAGARQQLQPGGEFFIIDALWPPDNNRLGRILRGSDNGAHVRALAEWGNLFGTELKIRALRPFAQWPFDYVFLRTAGHDATPGSPGGSRRVHSMNDTIAPPLPPNKYNPLAWITGEPDIGEGCWIGAFTLIDGLGGLKIGCHCDISSGAKIISHSTVRRCLTGRVHAAVDKRPTEIGDHVFIGSNAVVLMGAKVGHHSIIGAGTVVLEGMEIPPYSLVAGVPARIVRSVKGEIETWKQNAKTGAS